MTTLNTIPLVGKSGSVGATRFRGPTGLLSKIGFWYRRHMQRQALRGLSPELLADVGIDSSEAEREVSKPFWRD